MTATMIRTALACLATATACSNMPDGGSAGWQNLDPIPNTRTDIPPQPARLHPYAVAVTSDGTRAIVTLRGSEVEPGDEVVILNVPRREVVAKLRVGARPYAVEMHPDDRTAVVLSHFSPYAAVVDVREAKVTGRFEVGYYAQDMAFSADGSRLFIANRATDQLEEFLFEKEGGTLRVTRGRNAPAGANPLGVGLSPDGTKIYVGDSGGLKVRVYSVDTLEEISSIFLNAPIFDIEPMGEWVVVTTLNDTNGLPCESDGDFPGRQGDGVFPRITDRTCSRGFADIQNEIAFLDPQRDLVAVRYTSDTAEVSEQDREGDHPPELMKVVGALPGRVAVVSPTRAFVVMGASFEVAEMTVEASAPPVPPRMEMPRVWETGFAPRGLGTDAQGRVLVVANSLSETVSIIEVETGKRFDVDVGLTSPPFPATSEELGELLFHTSKFSTDGDMSCTHCHPDVENDGKAWGVDVVRAYGRRSTMMLRNLNDSKPLLIEGVFDEYDFSLELEGIAFRPDFHDSSYALQVERRDRFFREVTWELIGREAGFDEMVRALGDYLVGEPRLLPSPFSKDTPQVERGRALFERPDVGCAACHPPPTFASEKNFFGVTTLGTYDFPRYDLSPDISVKFIENAKDGFFSSNTLRGLWDRKGAFFHDGRARTLRETLLTPGHPCLQEGERPFNEFNGQVDTNGGVSHLTCEEIDDLVAFLKTID